MEVPSCKLGRLRSRAAARVVLLLTRRCGGRSSGCSGVAGRGVFIRKLLGCKCNAETGGGERRHTAVAGQKTARNGPRDQPFETIASAATADKLSEETLKGEMLGCVGAGAKRSEV
jgi:hypothetical protein